MAQIHISKDPSGQIADIFPYDSLVLNKVLIHPATNRNYIQRQLITAQTSQGNRTWILRRSVNNFSKDFYENIEKLVCCPPNSTMKKTKPASPKLSLTLPKPAGQMRRTQTAEPEPPTVADEASLLADLRALIHSARQRVATVANATQTLLYWHVGRRSQLAKFPHLCVLRLV